jgi:Zn-dependent metalloprotease
MIRNCIVPPYILRAIFENGDPTQKALAWSTLADSEQFRGERRVMTAIIPLAAIPPGRKRRSVSDAHHTYDLPGRLARSEGAPRSKDPRVNEAYGGAGITYDMFNRVFSRNSIDGSGSPLIFI